MSKSRTIPLVTFALFVYNQEQFVSEAVKSALAQDYESLEIIISDDCSSDNTFAIIENIVKNYSGSHHVILNRNNENFGIVKHVNSIFKKAKGELIILAAGDDISLKNRTSSLVSAWLKQNKKSDCIYSNYIKIDTKSNIVGNGKINNFNHISAALAIRHGLRVFGAVTAWTRDIIYRYGEISIYAQSEDFELSRLAYFGGGFLLVDKPLVKYRVRNFKFLNFSDVIKVNEMWAKNTVLESIQQIQLVKKHNKCNLLKNAQIYYKESYLFYSLYYTKYVISTVFLLFIMNTNKKKFIKHVMISFCKRIYEKYKFFASYI